LWSPGLVAAALGAALLLAGRAPGQQTRPPLPAEEQDKVNLAIDRGVAYLLAAQNPLGSWGTAKEPGSGGGHLIGYTALPALTLLECGVPADNSAVQRAALIVRAAAPKIDSTYELALAILFLDRLGESRDEPLIETFALKLISGQRPSGGWSYRCPNLNTATQKQLLTVLRLLNPGSGMALLPSELSQVKLSEEDPKTAARPRPAGPNPVEPVEARRRGRELDEVAGARPGDKRPPDAGTAKPWPRRARPKEEGGRDGDKGNAKVTIPANLAQLPVLKQLGLEKGWVEPKEDSDVPLLGKTDNSNSQFALLALWAAHRHGVPTERTMTRVARRYRGSQNADGGWGYNYASGGGADSSPAMTCAGLIGLAVGHGMAQGDQPGEATPAQDPLLVKAFVALSRSLGDPAGRTKDLPMQNLYFLWSVERVAMLYDLKKIGEKEWYRWGAETLVANQGEEGSWDKGGYPGANPVLDTSLALLFLRRANLAADLTARLRINPERLSTDIGKGQGVRESASVRPEPPPTKPPAEPPSPAPEPSAGPETPPTPPQPPSPAPTQEAETGGGKKWLFVALGVCVLLLIGGGAALWFGRGSAAKEPEKKRDKPRKKKRSVRKDDDG
jgi:hypothetical protein